MALTTSNPNVEPRIKLLYICGSFKCGTSGSLSFSLCHADAMQRATFEVPMASQTLWQTNTCQNSKAQRNLIQQNGRTAWNPWKRSNVPHHFHAFHQFSANRGPLTSGFAFRVFHFPIPSKRPRRNQTSLARVGRASLSSLPKKTRKRPEKAGNGSNGKRHSGATISALQPAS